MPTFALQTLPLALIDPPADAHRKVLDRERLGALADSIATEGLHQPPGVRGPLDTGRYEVIFGHRRYLAMLQLRWVEAPAKVYPPDADVLLIRASENLNREQLSPVEEAEILGRERAAGAPLAALARKFRRSPAWVDARLALLEYPPDLREPVHAGELSLAVAAELLKVDHEPYRKDLVAEAQRTGASTRTVGVWVAHYLSDRDRIVRNVLTVEEIASRRESWVIKVACELCGQESEYSRTRSVRCCQDCFRALAEELNRQPGPATAPATAHAASQ